MDPNWLPVLVFIGIAFVVSFGMLLAAAVLRVRTRKPEPTRLLTYECGESPDGTAWIRFNPRYYVIALIFVVFDVETVFMLPWTLNIKPLGTAALVEMFAFVGILLLGWVYALRKGALQWL